MPLPICPTLSRSVRACFPARHWPPAQSQKTVRDAGTGGLAAARRARPGRRGSGEPAGPFRSPAEPPGPAPQALRALVRPRGSAPGGQRRSRGAESGVTAPRCARELRPERLPREGRSEPGPCTNTNVTGGRRPKQGCQRTRDAAGGFSPVPAEALRERRAPLTGPGPSRGSGRWRARGSTAHTHRASHRRARGLGCLFLTR